MDLTLPLCVLYGSSNKQRLLPYTTLAHWFCITEAESKPLYYPTDIQIYFVDTIRIIIRHLKYLKLLQNVSDHKGSIIRELYTVLG